MAISRLSRDEISKELNELTTTLDKVSYVNTNKAKTLCHRLEALLSKINTLLSQSDLFAQSYLEEQKNRITVLFGRCDTLIVDSEVVELAEKAEKLSIESGSSQLNKISELKKTIEHLKKKYALSQDNRKLVRFAEILMERFSSKGTNQNLISSPITEIPDAEVIAFALFELGQNLYYHEFQKAHESFLSLPLIVSHDLINHMESNGIDFKSVLNLNHRDVESIQKAIQIVIGFCDLITLYHTEFRLPPIDEIHTIFEAKEF